MDWVRLERTVSARIEDVWKMWTDPRLFERWYGPNGMSVVVETMDVSVGGRRKFNMSMAMPDKTMTMYFIGTFTEITPVTRLVYTESMCDADGNVLSPEAMGMPADHPTVTEVIVELVADGDQTRMTMTHVGVPADSQGAGGWAQALDKLVAQAVSPDQA